MPAKTARVGLLSNVRLLAIVAAGFALQIFAHHLPVLEVLFGTRPISAAECVAWTALGSIPLAVLETQKILRRRARRRTGSMPRPHPADLRSQRASTST